MKSTDITLYAYNFRSRAERVMWTLDELNLDYTLVRLNPLKGETRSEEFSRLNPSHKVPVLVHNDTAFTESLAIMEYLDSLAEEPTLVPLVPMVNYRFRNVISLLQSEIEAYLWIVDQAGRLARMYPWPDGTGEVALERVQANIPRLFKVIGRYPFVCSESFTLADIYTYHVLKWARGHGVEVPKHVHAYMINLNQRPAIPAALKLEA